MNILDHGSYLGIDRFGINVLQPDEERVAALLALLKKNREQQLVISHDSVWCWRGEPIPAALMEEMDDGAIFNPTHFHDTIAPKLLEGGATEAQIKTMLVDNPRRFFAGEVPAGEK